MQQTISLGFDHGALALRDTLLQFLQESGHTVIDHGTFSADSVDYPDFAKLVALDLSSGKADLGILCCTTGIGMSIAANKHTGIRAALPKQQDEATLSRQHNDANVLCMGALHTTGHEARALTKAFLSASFESGGRHERRVCKFSALDKS